VAQKSTLIKILLGELQTTNGIVSLNSNVRTAYFTQHHVDQLNLGVSAVQWLRELFPGTLEVECRRHLGRFGLIGDVSHTQQDSVAKQEASKLISRADAQFLCDFCLCSSHSWC
jgi:ATP-binding cassette subfamily F protein 3